MRQNEGQMASKHMIVVPSLIKIHLVSQDSLGGGSGTHLDGHAQGHIQIDMTR